MFTSNMTDNKCSATPHVATVTRMIVSVSSQFYALHQWVSAPDVVGYLRLPHKHKFTVDLYVTVTEADREVEFYLLIDALNTSIKYVLSNLPHELAPNGEQIFSASCETFATEIGQDLFKLPYLRNVKALAVRVAEDGASSAYVDLERL